MNAFDLEKEKKLQLYNLKMRQKNPNIRTFTSTLKMIQNHLINCLPVVSKLINFVKPLLNKEVSDSLSFQIWTRIYHEIFCHTILAVLLEIYKARRFFYRKTLGKTVRDIFLKQTKLLFEKIRFLRRVNYQIDFFDFRLLF